MLLTAAAVVVCAAALVGMTDPLMALLYWSPVVVIIGMLLARRFVGESKILARLQARRAVPRAPRRRWSHLRDRALSSVAERTTQHLRGPPVPLAA